MEAWRQSTGRALAAAGAPVKDVTDPASPFVPPVLAVPTPRFLHAINGVAASLGGEAAGALAAGDELADVEPFVTSGAGVRVPVHVSPSSIPLDDGVVVLTGPPGVGKSGVLNYAVLYARANGWLVVFIPNSFDVWYNSMVLVRSRSRPGFVDQHDKALAVLREVFSAHGGPSGGAVSVSGGGGGSVSSAGVLADIPQRGVYASYKYLPRARDEVVTAERDKARAAEDAERSRLKAEASAAGKLWDSSSFKSRVDDESDTAVDRTGFTLRDMVEWGLHHPAAATDALLDFLSELRSVSEAPVLVAVDGLNLMYEATDYPLEGSGRTLAAEELSVMAAFQCLGEDGLK